MKIRCKITTHQQLTGLLREISFPHKDLKTLELSRAVEEQKIQLILKFMAPHNATKRRWKWRKENWCRKYRFPVRLFVSNKIDETISFCFCLAVKKNIENKDEKSIKQSLDV